MATASGEGIQLWDAETGTNTATFDGPLRSHRFVGFSSDGNTLVSAGGQYIKRWDVATATNTATVSLESNLGNTAAFSPDATIAAGGYSEGPCSLWDVATGTRLAILEGHKDGVNSLAFSPDGRTLASGSSDHTVRLWDVATHTDIATLEDHSSWVESVAFSPDGRTLASGVADRTIALWNVATRTKVATLEGHGSWVRSVAFSPDGTTLASGEQRGKVMLWEVDTGNARTFASDHASSQIVAVALSPDGRTLATGSRDLTVRLWDLDTGAIAGHLEGHVAAGHPDWILALDFSPDGKTLASGSSDNTVRLWDVATADNTLTLASPEPGNGVSRVDFSPDGEMVAAGHKSGMITLWEVAGGIRSVALEGHTDQIGSMAFSLDGKRLVSGSSDRTVRVWDVATGNQTTLFEMPADRVVSVAFSADGLPLAFGGLWRRVELWEVATSSRIGVFSGEHTGSASSAALSPDGRVVVIGESTPRDNTWVEVWDVVTGENTAILKSHSNVVTSVAYSLDRPIFATGSTDGTVLVWDMQLILPHPRSMSKLAGDEQEGLPSVTLADPLVIEVRDQHGDPLEGVAVTFAVTRGGGMLSVERATTDARGQAATILTLGQAPGPNAVEVAGGDLEPVVFTARTQSIPATLGIVGGDDQQGPSGASLAESLVVSVLDQAGSPYAGATVTFAVTVGGGILSVSTATTDPQGRATTTLTLGRTPGPNSVEVTVRGLAPVTFTAIGIAIPQTLAKLSGDGQAAVPGAQLAEPLVVSVRDQNGSAYPGAVVTFALIGDGGALSALTDTTDSEGQAASTLTLGDELGTYMVLATVADVLATVADLEPVTFTIVAKASPDFDGDGQIGFSDFFLFAEAFGGGDPRFDLDGSGSVDFGDFFLFAESFGQPARARLVALARELIGLPDGPQLQQNAPNPFNSGTAFSWFQLQPGVARLEVFALTGQRVAVLQKGPCKAGRHRLRWDGRDDHGRPLASGVYVYRLVTPRAVQARKLTLLR